MERDFAAGLDLVADEIGVVGCDGDGRGRGSDRAFGLGLGIAGKAHLDQDRRSTRFVGALDRAAPVGRMVAAPGRCDRIDHDRLAGDIAALEIGGGAEPDPHHRSRDASSPGRRRLGDRKHALERRCFAGRRERRRP